MATINIKSTHPESQGEFVVIEAEDFDPEKHEIYEEEAGGDGKLTVADIKAKLDELNIEYPANAKKAELLELLPKE